MNATEISLEPATPPPGCLAVLLAVGLVAGAVQVAFVAGCASAPELPEGALEFVTNYLDRISQEKPGAGADSAAEPTEGNATAPAPGDADEDKDTSPAPAIAWKYGGWTGRRRRRIRRRRSAT